MTEPVQAAATTASAPAQTELPPNLVTGLRNLGIEPNDLRGAWSRFGLTAASLPVLLQAQGMTIEQMATELANAGVKASDFPALANFLGVPADQRAELQALLHLPADAPAAGQSGTAPAAPSGDTAHVSPAAQAGHGPLAGRSPVSLIPPALIQQVVDRNPENIAKDRSGRGADVGVVVGQFGATTTVGARATFAPELARARISGNDASGWNVRLQAPIGVAALAGSETIVGQADLGLRTSVGHTWAAHSALLGHTVETSVGPYVVAGAVAHAGLVAGQPNLAIGAKVGGGLDLGPVFLEVSRQYTTAGINDQASVGIRANW